MMLLVRRDSHPRVWHGGWLRLFSGWCTLTRGSIRLRRWWVNNTLCDRCAHKPGQPAKCQVCKEVYRDAGPSLLQVN
jgi:hypothetical protein